MGNNGIFSSKPITNRELYIFCKEGYKIFPKTDFSVFMIQIRETQIFSENFLERTSHEYAAMKLAFMN